MTALTSLPASMRDGSAASEVHLETVGLFAKYGLRRPLQAGHLVLASFQRHPQVQDALAELSP